MSEKSETINNMWIKMVRFQDCLMDLRWTTLKSTPILRKVDGIKDNLQWAYKDVRTKEINALAPEVKTWQM